MRCAVLLLLAVAVLRADKMMPDERISILRGMLSEYGTAKILLPRSKKPLPIKQSGYDRAAFDGAAKEFGPAARAGDLVQVTKVDIEDDKVILQINGGFKGGKKWYDNVQVGVGMGGAGQTVPLGNRGLGTAGTSVVVLFDKEEPPRSAQDLKKMLAPVLDFEKQRSATENYIDTLPPEIQKAIKEQKPAEGMDREALLMAMGHPRSKVRETKDGEEFEDWIYGQPPGKITFVTLQDGKVVRIKETYAGLGGETRKPLPPQD